MGPADTLASAEGDARNAEIAGALPSPWLLWQCPLAEVSSQAAQLSSAQCTVVVELSTLLPSLFLHFICHRLVGNKISVTEYQNSMQKSLSKRQASSRAAYSGECDGGNFSITKAAARDGHALYWCHTWK